MADLIGTMVAKNYQKISPSSMFGTRELLFVKVVADNGGTSSVDLTKQKFEITGPTSGSLVGTYADADSYFSRAVRALQTVAEVFFIGEPDQTSFVVAISRDTVNDGDPDVSQYSILESAVKEGLGVGSKAPVGGVGTMYDGTITVTELTAVGDSIA